MGLEFIFKGYVTPTKYNERFHSKIFLEMEFGVFKNVSIRGWL
jgi:hypothetical protein